MLIKREIRILGWDDGPFPKGQRGKTVLVGAIFRGGSFMDGLLKTEIDVDGLDATEKMVEAVRGTRHRDIRVVMLGGITFGGFNFVDIKRLHEETGLPVIVVVRKKADMKKFRSAMRKLPGFTERWRAVANAGEFFRADIKGKSIYFQKAGLTEEEAERIIRLSASRGLKPEPLRVAHMIASGIVKGESIGRA